MDELAMTDTERPVRTLHRYAPGFPVRIFRRHPIPPHLASGTPAREQLLRELQLAMAELPDLERIAFTRVWLEKIPRVFVAQELGLTVPELMAGFARGLCTMTRRLGHLLDPPK
jgi:DNA-directed RNA polymerase specialized sigma24 family protein